MTDPLRYVELSAQLLTAYFDQDRAAIDRLRDQDPAAALDSMLDCAAVLLEDRLGGEKLARDHVVALSLVASVKEGWH